VQNLLECGRHIEGADIMIIDSRINPVFRPARYNDSAKAEVAELRSRLLALRVWPEAGDEFLALLPVSRWNSPPLTEEDNQWLLMVAQDALRGVDIGANYPAFFQKLITNANLRQAFLDELERRSQNGYSGPANGILKQ
jgi:hypothetical protein